MSLTPLVLNGCQTPSTVLATANQVVANQTGTTTASSNTKIGMATGYGEIYAKGNTSAWPGYGSLQPPSGNGWLFDVTTLENQTIPAGNWQWAQKLRCTNVNVVADIIVRAYKYNSISHTYTSIGTITLSSTTVGSTATPFTSALTSFSSVSFATGDKLYVDLWLNIRTNNTGTNGATFNIIECNNASSGLSGIAQLSTPGYQATSTNPILATSPTTLSFSAMAGGSNPASQNDTLAETAGVGTNWTSAITYGSGSGWLSISPTSGTLAANGTQVVAFTCTTGSLTTGTYTATVTYTATTGGATATVTVTFVVTAAPALSTSPASLSFTAIFNGKNPPAQTDILKNTGGTSTAWTAAISYGGGGSGWLSLSSISGTLAAGAQTSLTLNCATGSLAIGTYTATVTFTAATGGATATIGVTFTVTQLHMITIGGNPVAFDEDTFQLSKKLDERWRCQFTVLDYAGTQQFSYRQQVVVTDAQMGILFAGFVADVKQDKTNMYPSPGTEHQIDCIDNRGLADKRTSNYLYANQYAGVIAAHQVQQYLAAEGVTMQAALGWFEALSDWQRGTMAGTTATTNAYDANPGDGDIELALAGTAVTKTEQTSSDWNSYASMNGIDATTNTLQLASHATLEYSGLLGGNYGSSFGNAYAYQEFWNGSYTIVTGDVLQYTVWINSSSPQIMAAVDFIYTDNSDLRDSGAVDQNGITCHPNGDLKGFADNQWYMRTIDLSSMIGKTINWAQLGFEGDSAGQYTAYFRDILIQNGSTTHLTLYQGSTPHASLVSPNQNIRISANGYSNVTITPVIGYEQTGSRISNTVALDAAGIYRSSLLTWASSIPLVAGTTTAAGTVTVSTSVDGGATWQPATNFAAVANLLAGTSLTGQTLQTQIVLAITANVPVLSPELTGITWTVQPSYVASKSDTRASYTSMSDWNSGTKNNVQASNGDLTLNSVLRNWDDVNFSNQTMFGNVALQQGVYRHQGFLKAGNSATEDATIRFDFAGQWGDFIASIDLQVPVNGCHLGLIYRTTGWQNSNDTYAYEVDISVNSISLGKGTNNSSGSGSRSPLGSATLTLNAGDWHTLTVAAIGSSHTIYLDGVSYITATDGSYSSGYLGVRNFNASSATQTGYFDNFGVIPQAALAPNAPIPNWVSPSINLGNITVGTSIIQWNATQPNGTVINVLASVNGGTYQACTNGAVIPGLTQGTVLTSGTLQIKVQLQTNQASSAPIVSGLTVWVLSAYSSSGTWTSPSLSLAFISNADTALVNWNGNLPNTNTAITMATSIDGGVTWQAVVNQGDPIANITTMPSPFVDSFTADSHTNYTQTNLATGGLASWVWDVVNARLLATQTTSIDGVLIPVGMTSADMQVIGDFNYSDSGGLIARMVDAANAYFLSIADASASVNANTAKLYKTTGSVGGGGGGVTALIVYGSNVADTTLTTAGQMGTTTGGVDVIAQTKMGTATGYGEIVAFGTSAAWAALAGPITSIAPTGKGWLFDSNVLASQQFPSGTWQATLFLRATVGTPTVTMYVRFYAYDTVALTYTLIGSLASASTGLTATATPYTLSGSLSAFTLNANQKLYCDVWMNVTGAASSSSCQIAFHESSSASLGVNGEMQITTPGYQFPVVTTALTVYLANAHSNTLSSANQLYTLPNASPSTTTRDVVVGTATGYGELTSHGATSGSGTDSPYGVVYYFSGSTPSYVPLQLLDLLVGGNRSGLGAQTGLVPGGPIWFRPQLLWKQFELTNQHTSTPAYDATALGVADDLVSRCNAANILIDFCIQAPPQWRRTIDLNGNTVPYDGQTYIGTLNQSITAGIQYTTIEVSVLGTNDTISDQQQLGIDYNGTTEYVVAQGNYSAGAHTITIKSTAGKTFKAAGNHASGCVVENTGGQFASPADMDYYVKFFAARYNGTTTNVLTGLSQTALTIQAMQVNEDYDTPGNNLQRDYQSKWFVANWQVCGPHLRTIHPTCKLIGPAARRTGKSSIDKTYGLNHITTWTDYLFSYTPPGSSYAGCVTDASGNLLLDGLDYHYYRDNVTDNNGNPSPDPAIPLPGPTDGSYVPTQAQELLAIKAVAAKYVSRNSALANFDVWCTETGWDVFDDGSSGVTGTTNIAYNTTGSYTSISLGSGSSALSGAIADQAPITIDYANYPHGGTNSQEIVYCDGGAANGATTIPITSVLGQHTPWTPSINHASGAAIYSATINFVTQQQQADFICGPSNSGNLTGNPGVYEQHRTNGGSHVFIWTMNPLTTAKMYLDPPSAVTTKDIVQNEINTPGTSSVFTLLQAYTAMQAYIAAHPAWQTGTWLSGASIGSPTGSGWMLDATTLDAQQIVAGTWQATLKLAAFQGGSQVGSLGANLFVRAFKYSGGLYTQLVQMELDSITIGSGLDFNLPSTAGTFATFAPGDKLYIDVWANITSNTNMASNQAIRIQKISNDTSGLTGSSEAEIVTPGFASTIGSRVTTLLASATINFVRGMYHRFNLDVEGSTITASMDGTQLMQVSDTSVSGVGGGGLLAGVINGNVLQCYGLRVAPYGQNVSALSVLTQATLLSTDPTQTPQLLDLQTFVANPSIGAGTLIPSANYKRTFVDKDLDDLAKQSNYGWYIDQFKQVYFQDRQTSPAPWILSSNTLALPSDLEVDTNLLVEVAGDMYRNRQVLTGVTGTANFEDQFTGDGKSTSFTLRYPVAVGTIPTITLDNQPQTIGLAGGPTMQWYYTEGSATIAQDNTGTVLSGLDTLTVSYTGTFPTEVVLDNTAAQAALAAMEGGSGIVEAVEDVSKQNMTYAAAVVYAQQLLARYCVTGRTLTCTIFRNGLAIGQILSVFVSEEHLSNVQLLIRQIDIKMRTQPGQTVLYEYSVQATELPNPGSWQKLISSGLLN